MLTPRPRLRSTDVLLDVSPQVDHQFRSLVQEEGYLIRSLDSGTDLLDAIRDEAPALLVMEAERQGEDGFIRCARLRGTDEGRDLLIILLLSQTLLSCAAKTYEHGADDFVPLPPRPLELRSRVRAHLATARLRRFDPFDSLTGVYNLGYFQRQMDSEWQRAERGGYPVCIVCAAVDGYESYVEALGSEAGSACLAAVGQALFGCLERAGDMVARMEGCTFACILPDTDVPGGLALVLRMQAQVNTLSMPCPGPNPSTVSLSFGFAAVFSTQMLGPEELLWRARRNLARAQARGGNCWSAGEET